MSKKKVIITNAKPIKHESLTKQPHRKMHAATKSKANPVISIRKTGPKVITTKTIVHQATTTKAAAVRAVQLAISR